MKITPEVMQTAVQHVQAVRAALVQHVHGQDQAIDALLACVFGGGHALLEGVPGTGKTTLAKSLANILGLDLGRIQFTPDLMPADVTGTTMMAQGEGGVRGVLFRPGPIFHSIVLADEINRAAARTQSALLEAMAESQVTVAGETHRLPSPFMVLATENPLEMEGTHRLPQAQLDRFMMRIDMAPSDHIAKEAIIQEGSSSRHPSPTAVVDGSVCLMIMRAAKAVLVAPHVDRWIAQLVLATADSEVGGDIPALLETPCSPRAAMSIRSAAQVVALSQSRLAMSCSDVMAVVRDCLRHRVMPGPMAIREGVGAKMLLERILDAVPPPAARVMQ